MNLENPFIGCGEKGIEGLKLLVFLSFVQIVELNGYLKAQTTPGSPLDLSQLDISSRVVISLFMFSCRQQQTFAALMCLCLYEFANLVRDYILWEKKISIKFWLQQETAAMRVIFRYLLLLLSSVTYYGEEKQHKSCNYILILRSGGRSFVCIHSFTI